MRRRREKGEGERMREQVGGRGKKLRKKVGGEKIRERDEAS